MFLSLARPRAFAFTTLSLPVLSHALQGSLFTSSVTYCSPPETLLVQQFDVEYFAANGSISFNISAESVESNVNVSASMLVNAFGMDIVNITINLCDILNGALCPLPQYNFIGADSISLPDDLSSKVPSIAFKVPDLEAFAQLTLIEESTGDIKACVQATLSNGLSTRQKAVEWTTGGITLFTLLVAMWQSFSPSAVLPYRLLDLIFLFQSIATSALLDLNYPVTFRSFALNFAWTLSLFPSSTNSMQGSINNMRALTGGGLTNSTSTSAVGFVNRKLSPFNTIASSGAAISLSSLGRRSGDFFRHRRDVAVVTAESGNVLQAGIPIYVSTINIAAANAFMTVFLCTLILVAITLFVFTIGWISLFAMERFHGGDEPRCSLRRRHYFSWARNWILRLCLIMFTPILVFAFYQWTLKDSWLSILFAVIAFIAVMGLICYWSAIIIRSNSSAPHAADSLSAPGTLYGQYRPAGRLFFLAIIIAAFFRAIFISLVQSTGLAQVVLLLILEIILVVAVFTLRPHKSRGADVFSSFLGIVRVVCTGLMVAFIESINVKAIPRYAIGLVLAVIYSVTTIVVVINIIIHSGPHRLWRRRNSSRRSSLQGSSNAMLEKGEQSTSNYSSSEVLGRPMNPTPERNTILDPEINQPYNPSSPTATIDYASTRLRDSQSTTFGSVLPRRWSFTPLHTPTESSAYDHSPPFEGTLGRTSEEQLDPTPYPALKTG
ncbi:hypothetical protein D9757_004302 [Collybiopsis confluens]|uniref:ML-like domain-containing protein n=1 Tax=Collybiopsis confluens TaxID=2823264 RepID=A0A8H5HU60_9AGAR|nr:hypothetical protein D9757_004302 [Collybiopsis confluens]